MFVCDFDEYHIQLDVANTCNIMSYAFMLIIHDNGITTYLKVDAFLFFLNRPTNRHFNAVMPSKSERYNYF